MGLAERLSKWGAGIKTIRPAHFRELIFFAAVGGSATLLYGIFTLLAIDLLQAPPALSSSMAYLCSAVWSYLGHRWLTFMSRGPAAIELRKFMVLTASGLLTSAAVMKTTSLCNLPTIIGVGTVAVMIPVTNFVVLKFWVFRKKKTL